MLLVASTLFGLVLLRRKDFSRRRALGATKTFIVLLLVVQSGIVSLGAAVTGSALAALALNLLSDPQPPPTFYLSTVILATAAGLIAAVVPGLVASSRDPIRELRVP
ncbi:FtsX-like permease family protein [Paenarthrobacter nicotinovorans]|uniref:FtsX-like permease family protein n=1 Tax=Paenarthrobacter nicotinovorans TaxID=29320 RepID=UPI003D6DD8BD